VHSTIYNDFAIFSILGSGTVLSWLWWVWNWRWNRGHT